MHAGVHRIAILVTREGLPLTYEVFAGTRNDVTTLDEVVKGMKRKHGRLWWVWVVDHGIPSEEKLAWVRERGAG